MGAPPPVAIGTRGTVGSLVRKEIEYFTMFELERRGCCSQKHQPRTSPHVVDKVSPSGNSGRGDNHSSFWVLLMTWKRKKRRCSSSSSSSINGFLPKMCSVADVAETNQLERIPGYTYRILNNNDINKFKL